MLGRRRAGLDVRVAQQFAQRAEGPRSQRHHRRVAALVRRGQPLIGEVLLGEVLRHALQPLLEYLGHGQAQVAVHEADHLALAVEGPREIVGHAVFAEELHHRSVRAPAEGLGHLEAVAIQRLQFDDAQAVELRQVAHGLGIAEGVHAHDLLERPLAERAQRHDQQALVRHDGALLFQRQFVAQQFQLGHLARQLREVALEHAADLVDALQWHVALGEHPLHAGLGQPEFAAEVRIGQLGKLQLALEDVDDLGGGAHEASVKVSADDTSRRGRRNSTQSRCPPLDGCAPSPRRPLRGFTWNPRQVSRPASPPSRWL